MINTNSIMPEFAIPLKEKLRLQRLYTTIMDDLRFSICQPLTSMKLADNLAPKVKGRRQEKKLPPPPHPPNLDNLYNFF